MLVEVANAGVFGCLRRMGKEPEQQRAPLKAAAVLANGNLRLTRILNALLSGLAAGRMVMPTDILMAFQKNAEETLARLALCLEQADGHPPQWDEVRQYLDRLQGAATSGVAPADWRSSTLEHATTEMEGLFFGAQALIRSEDEAG